MCIRDSSFTYSIAFANLAIAIITKSSNKNKHILSAVFLGCCLLSHLIPFLIYGAIYLFFWVKTKNTKIEKFSSVLIFSALTVRFTTSLIANLEFTTNMGYTPYTKLSDLIKSDIAPFMVISLLIILINFKDIYRHKTTSLFCLLYTSPSPRDGLLSRMPSSA